LPAAVSAFVFSFVGAAAVSWLPAQVIRPVILVLLVLVACYIFLRKDFGSIHAPRHEGRREHVYGALLGMVLGFYDGFFGPGTGSFLIFLFIRFFGFDFLAHWFPGGDEEDEACLSMWAPSPGRTSR